MLSHASWLSFSSPLYFLKIGSERDLEGGEEEGREGEGGRTKKWKVMRKKRLGGEKMKNEKENMGGIGKERVQKGRGRKRKERKREEDKIGKGKSKEKGMDGERQIGGR